MKQPLIIILLVFLAFLSGCATITPRTVWFKLPRWKKQEKTELVEKSDGKKEKGNSIKKWFNPFKRNRKQDNDKGNETKIASRSNESSQNDQLIDAELANATEEERAQMKRDLKGSDLALVRSVLNVWKNTRRALARSETQQASSDLPVTPEKKSRDFPTRESAREHQREDNFLLASQETPKQESPYSVDRPNRAGLGTNPWGNSSLERTRQNQYDRGGNNKTEIHKIEKRQQFASQTIAEEDASIPRPDKNHNPYKMGGGDSSRVQPIEYSEKQSKGMGRFFKMPGSNTQETTSSTVDEQGENARTRYLEKLIALTENELAAMKRNPQTELSADEQQRQYVEKQVYLRMLYLMTGEQIRSFDSIPGIPAADQEFWRQLFWGMANYFDHTAMPDARTRATQTVAQLQQATLRLQANANLQLRNLNFCHKISSFGNYETFKHSEFRPGQRLLLYSEVQNFKSNPSEDGKFYRTMLKSTISIHRIGNKGGTVAEFQFDPAEDLCRNYRKDYFHSYEIALPDNITLGPHVLTLTVTDQLGDKIATETLKFNVK
ncbi:hypothetical protein MNBD_PLANCTO02-2580 [hydrothermal vent metagenome]|uniref:Uncharacterized protein n=1 Tax=hydrothermal vent metagenome TaxID=652676 RepID=A0A3B1D2M7_9ZZZZ